jgi:hypothetical protein
MITWRSWSEQHLFKSREETTRRGSTNRSKSRSSPLDPRTAGFIYPVALADRERSNVMGRSRVLTA